MNFLAPLFLAGAAAVALPLIFHLIRRSSREKIVFSSLMFLDPSPPRITKRSRKNEKSGPLAIMAVLSVAALAALTEFRRRPIPPICLGQIKTHQLRAIQLVFLSAENAGEATGDPRKNLHSGIIQDKFCKYKRRDGGLRSSG